MVGVPRAPTINLGEPRSTTKFHNIYSTFRAVWIRGAGVKPLRGGVAPTPPVPNSCENRCIAVTKLVRTLGLRGRCGGVAPG